MPDLDDYLTEEGYLNLKQFQVLLNKLALVEEAFFKNFARNKENEKRNYDIKEEIWLEFIKQRNKKLEGKTINEVLFNDFYESINDITKTEKLNSSTNSVNIKYEQQSNTKDVSVLKQNIDLFNKSLKAVIQVS